MARQFHNVGEGGSTITNVKWLLHIFWREKYPFLYEKKKTTWSEIPRFFDKFEKSVQYFVFLPCFEIKCLRIFWGRLINYLFIVLRVWLICHHHSPTIIQPHPRSTGHVRCATGNITKSKNVYNLRVPSRGGCHISLSLLWPPHKMRTPPIYKKKPCFRSQYSKKTTLDQSSRSSCGLNGTSFLASK